MQSLEHRIRALAWQANRRTLPRAGRIGESVLDEVATLRDSGRFGDATELLERQPAEALAHDPVALNGLGHLRLGLGRPEEALAVFRRAEAAACFDQAKALINQGHALMALRRYGEAELAIEKAKSLKPDWFVPYLMLISVAEWRSTEQDRFKVRAAVQALKGSCSDWWRNDELWSYLLEDADYARIRGSDEFENLFGDGLSKYEEEIAK
jgi:tetratricopeptide (TPR) repeat protein